jgi:hypothetical protein
MSSGQIQEFKTPAQVTAVIRSAAFLGAEFVLKGPGGSEPIHADFEQIDETGSGRNRTATFLELSVQEQNPRAETPHWLVVGASIAVEFRAGDLQCSFSSALISVGKDLLRLALPDAISMVTVRSSSRRGIRARAEGWGSIRTDLETYPCRISLQDYSANGVGLQVSIPETVDPTQLRHLAGQVTAHRMSVHLNDFRVLHASFVELDSNGWSIYRLGCQNVASLTMRDNFSEDGRKSRRFHAGDAIQLESALWPGRSYRAYVEDFSLGGLRCRIPIPEEAAAFLPGSRIKILGINIEGRILELRPPYLRISIDIDNISGFDSWFLKFTGAFHPSMDTSADTFTDLALSFASAGGVSASFLAQASKLNVYLEEEMSDLKRNSHWIQTWVEKSNKGDVIGHISCVRYGDNIWYLGDLFGSQIERINKEFSRKFFESFVSYCSLCAPYPKTVATWIPTHPNWKVMSERIAGEFRHYVYEEALCYKIALLNRRRIPNTSLLPLAEVRAFDDPNLAESISVLAKAGLSYFPRLLGLDPDSYGSPLLKRIITATGSEFDRFFATISLGEKRVVLALSRFPAGTSVQRHQETIWVFSPERISSEELDAVINTSMTWSLAKGMLPSYVKLVTKESLDHLPAAMRFVVSDPRMWLLA